MPNPRFYPKPEQYFDADWGYRVITLDDAKGIRALIGKRKDTGGTAVRTYIFDHRKWTLAKAEAWVKEHVSASHELGVDMLERGDITEDQAAEFDFDRGITLAVFSRDDAKLEESDGLIWKQLLRPGVWHKPIEGGAQKIRVTWQMIEEIKKAFDAGVIPHVSVPVDHVEAPVLNTGFIEKLEVRKGQPNPEEDGLWCGIQFTEPDIEEKVMRGTIANISAYLSPNFPDTATGKVYPWVLRHAALTNEPVIHLKPFMASLAMSLDASKTETYVEEVVKVEDKEKQELEAKIQAAEKRAKEAEQKNGELLLGVQDKARTTEDKEFEARIQAAEKRAKEAEQKMNETGDLLLKVQDKANTYEREIARHRRALHEMEVKEIVLALQGKGIHDRVKIPANCGFAPVVLSLVEPVLKADESREKDIVLSLGSEEKMSVTDLILSVLNTVAQANGGLVSFAAKGTQDHSRPGAEPTLEDKDKKIDKYFKDRGLGGK